MTFTKSQIASARTSATATGPAPSFDPNASTMQTLPGSSTPSTLPTNIPQAPTGLAALVQTGKDYLSKLGSTYKNAIPTFLSDEQSSKSSNPFVSTGENALRGSADILNTIFAPITAGVEATADSAANNPEIQKETQNPVLGKVLDLFGGSQDVAAAWATAHPEAAKDLSSAATVALTAAGGGENGLDKPLPTLSDIGNGLKNGVDAVKNAADVVKAKITTPAPAPVVDTLASRIQDATPVYNPKMVGTNVRTPDITNADGTVTPGSTAPRIATEGDGLTGKRPVTVSASEHAAGTELNNVPNYPDNGTALQKMNATDQAISTEAESMRGGLQAEDKANPLNTTEETAKVNNIINDNLPEDIQQKLADGKTLPKTAAGKFFQSVIDAMNEYDGTREGKLDLRQAIDKAYQNARGKLAFGSDTGNIIDESATDIRNALNKDLADSTQNTDIQASLKKQSNLYRASDVLTNKAAAEAASEWGRIEQKYPSLKMLIRRAQGQGIMIPIRIGEGVLGIGAAAAIIKNAISGNK